MQENLLVDKLHVSQLLNTYHVNKYKNFPNLTTKMIILIKVGRQQRQQTRRQVTLPSQDINKIIVTRKTKLKATFIWKQITTCIPINSYPVIAEELSLSEIIKLFYFVKPYIYKMAQIPSQATTDLFFLKPKGKS